MVTIYLVSAGVPQRERIIGELSLRRCIDQLGLDPSQRVRGLREGATSFTYPSDGVIRQPDEQHVVASVGAREAWREWTAGYYWLDLSPTEAMRHLRPA